MNRQPTNDFAVALSLVSRADRFLATYPNADLRSMYILARTARQLATKYVAETSETEVPRWGAGAQLRVLFEDPFETPQFECFACLKKMTWDSSRGWWNCPECGYELSPDEARNVVQKLTAALKLLKDDVSSKRARKGFGLSWLLEKLFGRRKQLPP